MQRTHRRASGPASQAKANGMVAAGIIALLVAACSGEPIDKPVPLEGHGTQSNEVTVSGISSGAYMAGQFQFAHSDIVSGAAIIAGGPYGCSESMWASTMPGTGTPMLNLNKAINGCMLGLLDVWGATDPAQLAEKARRRAEAGTIGAIDDVKSDRVYLFSGRNDRTVVPSVVKAAAKFYGEIGVPQANIKIVTDLPAGHAFVTEDAGLACEMSDKPHVVDCDYDQAGSVLQHLYGPLNARSNTASGRFIVFDQSPYGASDTRSGLEDHGVIYIPQACETGGCRVHVAFHGCAQNRASGGEAFIRKTGFDRWADTNRLVILFPQVRITPFNPQGCWDWWGYTGAAYLTRNAPQIRAVKAMLDHLAAAPGSPPPTIPTRD